MKMTQHKNLNPIEVYTDAACLIARDKLRITILDDGECMVSAGTLKAIERLAEMFSDRDMAQEMAMPAMHRIEYEHAKKSVQENRVQILRLSCDPDAIIERLQREVGGCGQYYELWLPRMMGAIESHLQRYDVDKAVAAVLWATVDCGPEGPTEKDWEEAMAMKSEILAVIREATE